jgi:hypothetical protein
MHGLCVACHVIVCACVFVVLLGHLAAERNADALSRSLAELCRSVAEITHNSTGIQT